MPSSIYIPPIDSEHRIKIQTILDNEVVDNYDFPKETGGYIPLVRGAGKYMIHICQNVGGNKYKVIETEYQTATEEDKNDFSLQENCFVRITDRIKELAETIMAKAGENPTVRQKVASIADWLRRNIVYDFVKAVTVKKDFIPDLEAVLDRHMGICLEKACLCAALCRSQGIKCKVAIGHISDGTYHAWNVVYVDEEGKWYKLDTTTNAYKGKKYNTERYY